MAFQSSDLVAWLAQMSCLVCSAVGSALAAVVFTFSVTVAFPVPRAPSPFEDAANPVLAGYIVTPAVGVAIVIGPVSDNVSIVVSVNRVILVINGIVIAIDIRSAHFPESAVDIDASLFEFGDLILSFLDILFIAV